MKFINYKSIFWSIIIVLVGFLLFYLYFLFSFSHVDVTSNEKIINDFKDNKQIFVSIANDTLNNEQINKITNEKYNQSDPNLSLVFKKLKFQSIHKVGGYIYFVRNSGFEYGKGVIYSSSGDKPKDAYINYLYEIEKHWYLFISK